jgi:hypothetical protein
MPETPTQETTTSPMRKKSSVTANVVRGLVAAAPLAVVMLHGMLPGKSGPAATPSASSIAGGGLAMGGTTPAAQPMPLLAKGHPVDWFFVFKLNAKAFPDCGGGANTCPFGGSSQSGPTYKIGQQFAFASSDSSTLVKSGQQCLGATTDDPVGATFDEVYNGGYHYLIWNDQFHDVDPSVLGCSKGDCGSPWGHSKGMVAWNDAGEGFVMQVSTPSWPGAGSPGTVRAIGNTLGCIKGDDDVEVSQHFFALKLTEPDLKLVLRSLSEASVATDPSNPQVANIGGPADLLTLFTQLKLGVKSTATTLDSSMPLTLSTGVRLIAKPSGLHVPPWQMVSSVLGGIGLRTATWWASPEIPSTTGEALPGCWDDSLGTKPGAVEIATSGTFDGQTFNLKGESGTDGNHAKIGVSTTGSEGLAIFGDENQQGTLDGPDGTCESSQNGRGGMFFVMKNPTLSAQMAALIQGDTAPTAAVTK